MSKVNGLVRTNYLNVYTSSFFMVRLNTDKRCSRVQPAKEIGKLLYKSTHTSIVVGKQTPEVSLQVKSSKRSGCAINRLLS